MAEKMRLSSRISRKDASPARHNSRTGFKEQPEHIDSTKSKFNWYWNCLTGVVPEIDYAEMEEEYYEKHFRSALDNQNNRYKASRQYNNCKTMKQFMNSPRYKPEEQIIAVGSMNNTITKEQLLEIYQDYYEWHTKEYPEIKFLNATLHVDEKGAPHFHVRRVWEVTNGDEVGICQADVLAKYGFERPDVDKPQGKKNNPKMTYTKMVREKLLEICLQHGIDLEVEVKDADAKHLHPDEYKAKEKAKEELKKIQVELEDAMNKLNDVNMQMNAKEMKLNDIQMQINAEEIKLREIIHTRNSMEQLNTDFMVLHNLMLDDNAPVTLKTEQAQLVYNNYRKVRDELKKTKQMTDDAKEKLDAMLKLINLANDHAQGYTEGSYSSDPMANRYFYKYKQSRIEFEAFKDQEEKSAEDLKASFRALCMSVDTDQSSDEDDYSF